MQVPIQNQLLEHVLELIVLTRPLVESIEKRDRDLGGQVRRAVSSVSLNVAEGFGSAKGNARLRFQSARGSLYETYSALRTAVAWGYLANSEIATALALIDRLSA